MNNPNTLRDPFGYSVKWHYFPEDVLPLWVADMDFAPPEEVLVAINKRLEHRIGYSKMEGDSALLQAIVAQQAQHGLTDLTPDNLWLTSSVVPAIYAAILGLTSAGDGDEVITQVPVYPPFLNALNDYGRKALLNPLLPDWSIDFDHLKSLLTPKTRLLMLCNPQNPVGRVFSRKELEQLAEFALTNRLWIMSDEIWADLIFEGQHTPIASLDPEVAWRTVTLSGPCKTFNIAGLGGGVAISHNPRILGVMKRMTLGVAGHPNVLSMAAWQACFEHGQSWFSKTMDRLRTNRDFLGQFVQDHLPGVGFTLPQATYLAWLDFSKFPFASTAHQTMLDAKVGLYDGVLFGPQYQGWLRLNFATEPAVLQTALQRIAQVVKANQLN
jgi:cysteine-S-conjugate beta-lyase